MRSSRRVPRLFAIAAFVAVAVLALPIPAAAFSIAPNAVIRFWDCAHDIQWKGSLYYIWGPASQNKGTLDHCFSLWQLGNVDSFGRVQDGDSLYDTYFVHQTVDWAVTYSDGGWTTDNPGKVTVSSSIPAVSGAYTAAPGTMSSSSCSPLSVSVGLGPISVSVSEILCNNATLRRDSLTSTGAAWSTSNVIHTPRWEVAYMLKVSQGAKPTFTGRVRYPIFSAYKDGGQYCARGYCFPTYGYYRIYTTKTWVVTAP